MSTTLWIGFSFLALLVLFLIITVLIKDRLSSTQVNTLRFLTALCAGFAGGFFTGDALVKIDATISNGAKIGASGTAGFALFILVWFTYKSTFKLTPGFNFKVLKNWTFEQTVHAIMEANKSVSEFGGFSKVELSLVLNERELNVESALEALKRLKYLNNEIPNYTVTIEHDIFKIEKM